MIKIDAQPPSGGCVLKHQAHKVDKNFRLQPPSGGCVLKLKTRLALVLKPAQPPSGGCVLKQGQAGTLLTCSCPAAFGRLCVETLIIIIILKGQNPSRLRAAVC